MDRQLRLPLITNSPPSTFSLVGLGTFSFYHLLVVSFFVSVERFPETDFFTFLSYGSVHIALYSQLAVIEAFYGLAFLASIPKSSDNAAVEFAGLMIANGVIVNHMIFMINNTLFRYTTGWWIICIFLMFVRLTGDILKQIYAKIFATDPIPTSGIVFPSSGILTSTMPISTSGIPTSGIPTSTMPIVTSGIVFPSSGIPTSTMPISTSGIPTSGIPTSTMPIVTSGIPTSTMPISTSGTSTSGIPTTAASISNV